ncbi:hypothetical protein AB0N05_06865 [Nocardia sp. NPDC051030]|uniref:hypothetical protein n=1 Tax=Nocardia sp. NPDC051030 TaxID=3155162 RepID=UPI00341C040F
MTTHQLGTLARRAIHWHRPLMIFAAANAVLAVVAIVGMLVGHQHIAGSLAWFKPFKFAMSFVLYCTAWAWLISLSTKGSRLLWWAGTIAVATGAIEQVVIVLQVVRGTRSHFNNTTPFNSTLWSVMTFSIVVLFVATLAVGVMLAFQRLADAPTTWAIRLGIALSLVGMGVAFLMPGRQSGVKDVAGAHTVGAPDGTPGMPLTGWSTTAGDLRIPHFVGMHALQLLPLFAAVLTLLAPRIPLLRSTSTRLGLVLTVAAGYAGTLAVLTWQALRGQPLIHPDGATLIAFALLITLVAAGTAITLASTPVATPEVVR